MADQARKQTDKILTQMEKEVSIIYKRVNKEISETWDKYMKSHEPKVKSAYETLQDALKSGDREAINEAKSVYERTVKNVTLNNERFKAMVNETTAKIANTNEIALDYINGNMAKVYTLNYNAFNDEKISGYTFTLVNEQAVKSLAKEDKSLLPTKKLDIPKDKAWNTKSINAEILQGILQGENIPRIARRLSHVTDMNTKSAIRNARTMVTSAENKGRQDSFKKAESDGVIMKRMWIAAHDDRTRAWHTDLDGVEVDIDEAWSNEYGEIMYPGDPSADPANVYNCRCSIRSVVKGFKWNKEDEEDVNTNVETEHAKELGWNEQREYLENLGYSSEDADFMKDVISLYIENPDTVIQYTDKIDEMIDKMPKYEGTVYRGIVVNNDINYEVGGIIDENKISSWTSVKEVAREYSGSAEYESQNAWHLRSGQKSVIFVTDNSEGASISRFHGAGKEKYHKEVITDSKAEFIIEKVETKEESGYRTIEYVYLKRK